jgi:hypothetical protein
LSWDLVSLGRVVKYELDRVWHAGCLTLPKIEYFELAQTFQPQIINLGQLISTISICFDQRHLMICLLVVIGRIKKCMLWPHFLINNLFFFLVLWNFVNVEHVQAPTSVINKSVPFFIGIKSTVDNWVIRASYLIKI